MEKLQIDPKNKARVLTDAGNEVLLLTYPRVTGDTPAAQHTIKLITALTQYAEQTLRKKAAISLANAASEGRLLAFKRHRYRIELKKATSRSHTVIELHAAYVADGTKTQAHSLTMHWDKDELLQRRGRVKSAEDIPNSN